MNQAQVNSIAKAVTDSSLEFLAAKYNLSVYNVLEAINSNDYAAQQFLKVVYAGMTEAVKRVAEINNQV